MQVRQYNIFTHTRTVIFAIIWILSLVINTTDAQQFSSKTMAYNMEKFMEQRTTDRDIAYKYAEQILADLDSTVVGEDVATLHDFMSEYCENTLYKYDKALYHRLRAYSVYQAMNNLLGMTRSHALLSRLYLRNGDYHNSFSHSVKALEGGRAIGDSTIVREAYLAMEQVDYFYNHNQEQALEYNNRVAQSYNNREEAHQCVRALNNRFNYELTPDDVDDILKRCENICTQYGFNDQLLNVYLNVAMQEFVFENFDNTEFYLDQAKSLITNFKEEGYYYSALGFYYLNIGKVSQAIDALKHSITLLNNGDFDTKNVHSYFLLQDIYYNEGHFREAYESLMAFAETYTRQHNSQNIVELSKLISNMEIERNEQEHLRREEQYQRQQEHNRLITIFYALSIIILLIVGLLLHSRYRLERRNRELQRAKTEQELNHKNEIIKIQKLQQYQEQNNIDKLSEELGKIAMLGNHREMQNQLRHIIHRLQNNTKSGNVWAEVEMTLAGGNNAFYENLLKDFPNLTKNERKLCLFIHMKMSTKEISDITHQSLGSINVARSRLRQKFGLTGDDTSLIAFLDQYNTQQATE
ncbi:MAG: hypothetical protein IKJ79_03090 [Bacteroidaceae bacterium]|nr:hypothetical protein [Bacteroidaceae bacterium]